MKIKKREFNLNGHQLVLRTAKKEDAQNLLSHLKQFYAESKYLIKEPEEVQVTLEEEYDWIDEHLNSDNSLLIMAEVDGKYVGDASFEGTTLSRQKHRVSLGIFILKDYTNMGIGTHLMETLIEEAKNMTDETIRSVTDKTIEETQKYIDFKTAGTKGIKECEIRSIILPLLADHVLREANHYFRILKD